MPGREPSDYDLDAEPRHRGYTTRFWRCRNCGRERSRQDDFRRSCRRVVAGGNNGGSDETVAEDKFPPRTRRAIREAMTVARRTGARYTVVGESGTKYLVDVAAWTCSCPDFQERAPDDGCKHLQRVDLDIRAGNVPRPDGEYLR